MPLTKYAMAPPTLACLIRVFFPEADAAPFSHAFFDAASFPMPDETRRRRRPRRL